MTEDDVYLPTISIIMPVYNIKKEFLDEAIKSVTEQIYPGWELCIADASDDFLTKEYSNTFRIKVVRLEKNLGIALNTNEALKLATGDFVTFLDHDDLLDKHFLYHFVDFFLKQGDFDILYFDEDKTSDGINFGNRFLKPVWSPDLLRSYNYICHSVIYKKDLLKDGLREGFEGAQDYDLILRATEKAKKICHIPRIAYHWRMHPNSTAQDINSKDYANESGKKALAEHLIRIGRKGIVKDGYAKTAYKIEYELEEKPKVSILICNHNQAALLNKCITSILGKTTYPNYEIVIVENNSTDSDIFTYYEEIKKNSDKVKILKWNYKFNFSAINNYGIDHINNEYILLLNNDTEIINHDWLDRMMEYIVREDVGVVGAKLYYADGTVQHAGVVISAKAPQHVAHKAKRTDSGYFGRLQVVQDITCVTGACMMIKKSLWKKHGGLDINLAYAFNDVDYCFRLFTLGYRIVWTPYAELYHYESQTRGYEDTPEKKKRFGGEIRYMSNRWGEFLAKGDTMYRVG
jgi:GT2 family glycosyltransferase